MFLIFVIFVLNIHVLATAAESADVDIISELTIIKEQFIEREKLYENKLAEMENRLCNAEENSRSLDNFFRYKLAEAEERFYKTEERMNIAEKFFENKIAELEHKLSENAYWDKVDEEVPEGIDTLFISEQKLNYNEIVSKDANPRTERAIKPSKEKSKETDTAELLSTNLPQDLSLFHRKLQNKGKTAKERDSLRLAEATELHFHPIFFSGEGTWLRTYNTVRSSPTQRRNSFDTILHTFICPVNGIHMFQSSLLCDYGGHIETEIEKDGSVLARLYAAGVFKSYDQGFNSATVHCNKGGRVWVRVRLHDGDVVYAEQYSTFSGFLLWEL